MMNVCVVTQYAMMLVSRQPVAIKYIHEFESLLSIVILMTHNLVNDVGRIGFDIYMRHAYGCNI